MTFYTDILINFSDNFYSLTLYVLQ